MTTTRRTMLGALAVSPFVTTAAAATTASASATGEGGSVPKELKPGGELDKLAARLAESDEFSGTLLLTRKGRPVLSRAFGMADKEKGIPNGPDTGFALASVTKLFTAVAIGQLVQRGLIGYHMKIERFVEGFPSEVAGKVTVHHLLTHTSGMGDHHGAPGFREAAAGWTSPEQVMDGIMGFIRRAPLAFAPGAKMSYSNSGYHVLGAIVARIAGMSYYDYVRENIFRPAGMSGSDFHTRPQWLADSRVARPYPQDPTFFVGTPSGDAFATSPDLNRFGRALLDGKLLEAAHARLLLGAKLPLEQQGPGPAPGPAPSPTGPAPSPTGPAPSPTGPAPGPGPAGPLFQCYGPLASLQRGRWAIGLGGGSAGASTSIEMFPESGWVLTVLSNYGGATVLPIVSLARRLILESAA